MFTPMKVKFLLKTIEFSILATTLASFSDGARLSKSWCLVSQKNKKLTKAMKYLNQRIFDERTFRSFK